MKRSRTSQLPSCYSTGGSVQHEDSRRDPLVPFVEHSDGRRFWSDRFYLNSTTDSSTRQQSCCRCGNSEEPPTFPLNDFINHLDVEASVMGTFNIHPEWFRQNFSRFGAPLCKEESSSTSVPTFILHGHRGLENALAKRVKQADELEYETDREDDDENYDKGTSNLPIDENSSSKFQFFLPTTPKATETARHFVNNPNLQLCQVHCNWEKTESKKSSPRVSSGKENSTKTTPTPTTRETKMGVHHPKFFLLFEKSGDLVVIVTTSNLTPTNRSTVEGSWVQRFPRRNGLDESRQEHSNNDFGPVLQDFLVQLSKAAAAGPNRRPQAPLGNKLRLPLEEFLWKHVGIQSLSDFSSRYHFETAQTYLVPIIPGDYQYNPNDENSRCYYGRQRVRYILEKLATSTPKISKKTQDKSKSDRLLLQPTSLGSDWSRSQFASLIREYMGYYGGGNITNNKSPGKTTKKQSPHKKQKTSHDYSYHRDDFWVCNQADIVWPSDQFMIDVAKSMLSSESGVVDIVSPLQAASKKNVEEEKIMNSFVFNSSKTFNACDLEFVSRMAKYQPTSSCKKAPHFKSIARVFQNHVAMQKREVPPADAYFSWFLLTSACLSLGAQGNAIPSNDKATNKDSSLGSTVSYRNFELGVLFASHLPKKGKGNSNTKGNSDRQSVVYCFRPHKCSCNESPSSQPQLIHLPVPYNIKTESYFKEIEEENDDEDMVMNENPFFHEILDGSRSIGNMLMTPFGQNEMNQHSNL